MSVFDLGLPAVKSLHRSVAILSIYVFNIVLFWGAELLGGILGSECLCFGPGSSDVGVTGCFFFWVGSGVPGVSVVLLCASLRGIFRYHCTLVAGSESQLRPGGP